MFLEKARTLISLLCFCVFFSACAGTRRDARVLENEKAAPRIAVLPFESRNPYLPGTLFSDFFSITILQDVRGVDVIERKDIARILQEQRLSLSGAVGADSYPEIGALLGVDYILLGSVRTLDVIQSDQGSISVTVKLLDVGSGRVLWAESATVATGFRTSVDLKQTAEALVWKTARILVEKLGKSVDFRVRG